MDWRELRVGDVVVMTAVAAYVLALAPADRDGPAGMLRVYQRAVAKRSRLPITAIDELGFPWCDYAFRDKRGAMEYHSMRIDLGSYDRAPRRGPRPDRTIPPS
jgi:hypothetical protein